LGYFHNLHQQDAISIHLLPKQYPSGKEDSDLQLLTVLLKDITFFKHGFYNFFEELLPYIVDTFYSIYFQDINRPDEKLKCLFKLFVYTPNIWLTKDKSENNACRDSLLE
jgi:hypothetical protein